MSVANLLIITMLAELLEYLLQYKETLKESLKKMYGLFNNSPFIFFASNIGYLWFLLLFVMYDKVNVYLLLT